MKSLWTMSLMLLAAFAIARADVPQLVNYQGRLTDGTGSPVSDGSYSVTIALYDVASGGAPLWSETQSITTEGGLFTTLLGTFTPFDASLLTGTSRYLGISVGADPELSPRIRLASVPYALSAASGGGWTDAGAAVHTTSAGDFVGIGTTSPTHALTVVEPSNGLFVSRFESRNDLASIVELANSAVPGTWEWAISGPSSAFGTVPPGSMYFYNQGSSGIGIVIEPDNSISVGSPGGASAARMYILSSKSGLNRALEVSASGPDDNIAITATASGGTGGRAVYGQASGPSSTGGLFTAEWGVQAIGAGVGMYGTATSPSSSSCVGVSGDGNATGGQASYGIAGTGTGNGDNYGIYGSAAGGTTNWAGWFQGNTHVNGTLSKSAGSFRIDHPLDPQNRYLQHSFVESPDMMNVYNGNIVLDERGEAVVQLPAYFEALNRDFRYQLTCVGGYAPIYLADKMAHNQFRIAGGTAGLEVSWQVTGVRKDAYAQAHRLEVEVEKRPEERGRYLHPELFQQDKMRAIGRADLPRRETEGRSAAQLMRNQNR